MTTSFYVTVGANTFGMDQISDLDLTVNVNNIGKFSFTLSGEENPSVLEGQTASIYIKSYGSQYTKVLAGEIRRVRKKREESERIYTVEGVDTAACLQFRTKTKVYAEVNASSLVLDLISSLQEDGFISNDTSFVENCPNTLTYTANETIVLDALREVSDMVNYDFYVDSEKRLHWHLRNKYSTGITLTEEDVENLETYKEADNIVNEVTVLGSEHPIPAADDWTESLTLWTALSGDIWLGGQDSYLTPQAGEHLIALGSSTLTAMEARRYVGLDFSKIYSPKTLNFWLGIYLPFDTSPHYVSKITIKLGSTYSYYKKEFTNLFTIANPRMWRFINIDVGPRASGWSIVGLPSWDWIEYIHFKVELDSLPAFWEFYIDGLNFAGARYYGFSNDSNSKANWGLRTIPIVQDDNIKSGAEAQKVAETIINTFKETQYILDNLELKYGNETIVIGKTITVNTPETSITKRIVSISHSIRDEDLVTKLTLEHTPRDINDIINEIKADLKSAVLAEPETPPSVASEFSPMLNSFTEEIPETPAFSVEAEKIDTQTDFYTWLKVTIYRVDNVRNYVVAYGEGTASSPPTIWSELYVPQPASGNPVTKTEYLPANTSFGVKVCAYNTRGLTSGWSSIQYAVSGSNTVAPPPPSNLSATSLMSGILLEWDAPSEQAWDFSHYVVYVSNTTNPPANPTFNINGTYILYRSEDYGVTKYFWVASVDTSGNISNKVGPVNGVSKKVDTLDIAPDAVEAEQILNKAVTEAKINDYAVTNQKIATGAVTARTLTTYSIFLEGFTWTNNSPSSGYVSWTSGILQYEGTTYNISSGNTNEKYIFWEKPNSYFSHSNTKPNWSATRFMIAINDIPTSGTYVLVWNATLIHGGTLITGSITAQEIKTGSLEANLLKTGTITGSEANRIIQDGAIYSQKILDIMADKVVFSGTMSHLTDLTATESGVTVIEGGKIRTGSIVANKIATGTIVVGNLNSSVVDRLFSPGKRAVIEAWEQGNTTYINGGWIATGTVQTNQIQFNKYSSRPTPQPGRLYWYYGSDALPGGQLEFSSGTDLAGVSIIPKYPLFETQAPAESMLPNFDFEYDRDHDNVPDSWTLTAPGYLDYTESYTGGKSFRVYNYGKLTSTRVTIKPSQKYYASAMIKGSGTAYLYIYYYTRTGSLISSDYRTKTATSSWTKLETTTPFTSPSNAAYAEIVLYAPTAVNFDNIILSEMRAAVPTTGVVAGLFGYGTEYLTIPAGSGGNPGQIFSSSFTVPSEAHESYIVWLWIARRWTTSGDETVSTRLIEVSLQDTTDSIYYPGGLNYSPTMDLREPYGSGIPGSGAFVYFTIPKNVAGHSLRFLLSNWTQGYDAKVFIRRGGYGISPHTHR